ncbi:MAG: type IV toxin-antitoxin system AbiEi family antitoxin [Proteiniphilum sp.]|uniref:type IV toxin-antitoxin system AbiEi family antitoxin n=1 Tax=Proteiniphilum sp. TaxID=1926877 RepID=UPI000977E635|nr:type IV toxin-antitoxin system AbiEi family antitoxin [Proteiniphilum sp.]MDY9919467.1 type IV toxin-antitoxin system AbiEi family antitoxin [Proteiniphilum sp.]
MFSDLILKYSSCFIIQIKQKNTVSPLLVYADLMGSGDSRNIETAEIILNNKLQSHPFYRIIAGNLLTLRDTIHTL